MSYQSCFTGEQIDALLNKINTGKSSIGKVLFDGKFHKIATMSEKNLLSDSIYNYEFVLVCVYQEVTANGTLARQGSALLPTKLIVAGENPGSSPVTINTAPDGINMGYSLSLNFGDGTQLCISKSAPEDGVTSRNHGISTVVGLNLSNLLGTYEKAKFIGYLSQGASAVNTPLNFKEVRYNKNFELSNTNPILKAGKTYKIAIYGSRTDFNVASGGYANLAIYYNSTFVKTSDVIFLPLNSNWYCNSGGSDIFVFTPEEDTVFQIGTGAQWTQVAVARAIVEIEELD